MTKGIRRCGVLTKKVTRITLILGALALLSVIGLSGCGSKALKIGASEVPHAEILEFAKPLLEKEGIEIEIIEFSDFVQPNLQLADKQLDANFFQHIPYLEDMAEQRQLEITWVAKIHIEPLGIYSEKISSLSELEDGAQVGIPNDATNGGRALMLLEKAGLLTLEEGTGTSATIGDIVGNPRKLQLRELDAAMLPRVLPDLDLAVINGNFALQAGLSPTEDALFLEGGDSPYANVIAVRKEDKDNPSIQTLIKVLTSDEVRQFIDETYEGGVIPVF
ncbi:MAG TPA: MetQ/NlpA family ABC transporter substrate-binding protein [Firmicutes bacterium]|nr:MetQ/NlpA family ABC transporter substrate-binding protein [Candidatus Fermentithermobacillaceae bacterium]